MKGVKGKEKRGDDYGLLLSFFWFARYLWQAWRRRTCFEAIGRASGPVLFVSP